MIAEETKKEEENMIKRTTTLATTKDKQTSVETIRKPLVTLPKQTPRKTESIPTKTEAGIEK